MRLNKEIRAYIEKQLTEKSNCDPKLMELKTRYMSVQKEFEAKKDAIIDETNEKLAALAEEYRYERRGWNNDLCLLEVGGTTYAPGGLPEHKLYWDYKNKLNKAVEKKLEEIVIGIQLGGTKDELMDMLNNATFEVDADE